MYLSGQFSCTVAFHFPWGPESKKTTFGILRQIFQFINLYHEMVKYRPSDITVSADSRPTFSLDFLSNEVDAGGNKSIIICISLLFVTTVPQSHLWWLHPLSSAQDSCNNHSVCLFCFFLVCLLRLFDLDWLDLQHLVPGRPGFFSQLHIGCWLSFHVCWRNSTCLFSVFVYFSFIHFYLVLLLQPAPYLLVVGLHPGHVRFSLLNSLSIKIIKNEYQQTAMHKK